MPAVKVSRDEEADPWHSRRARLRICFQFGRGFVQRPQHFVSIDVRNACATGLVRIDPDMYVVEASLAERSHDERAIGTAVRSRGAVV